MLFNSEKCPKCDSNYDVALHTCPFCGEVNKNEETKKVSKNITMVSWKKQILLFVCGFVGLGLISTIVSVIAAAIGNPDFNLFEKTMLTTDQLFASNTITYVLILSGIIFVVWKDWKNILHSYKRWQVYVFALIGAAVLFGYNFLYNNVLLKSLNIGTNENQTNALELVQKFPIGSLIVMGVCGPIVEEFTYRLGLHGILRRVNRWLPYVASSFIFAIIHVDLSSLFSANYLNELLNFPTYLVSGLILSFIYEKEGIGSSTLAHILYNSFNVLLFIFAANL